MYVDKETNLALITGWDNHGPCVSDVYVRQNDRAQFVAHSHGAGPTGTQYVAFPTVSAVSLADNKMQVTIEGDYMHTRAQYIVHAHTGKIEGSDKQIMDVIRERGTDLSMLGAAIDRMQNPNELNLNDPENRIRLTSVYAASGPMRAPVSTDIAAAVIAEFTRNADKLTAGAALRLHHAIEESYHECFERDNERVSMPQFIEGILQRFTGSLEPEAYNLEFIMQRAYHTVSGFRGTRAFAATPENGDVVLCTGEYAAARQAINEMFAQSPGQYTLRVTMLPTSNTPAQSPEAIHMASFTTDRNNPNSLIPPFMLAEKEMGMMFDLEHAQDFLQRHQLNPKDMLLLPDTAQAVIRAQLAQHGNNILEANTFTCKEIQDLTQLVMQVEPNWSGVYTCIQTQAMYEAQITQTGNKDMALQQTLRYTQTLPISQQLKDIYQQLETQLNEGYDIRPKITELRIEYDLSGYDGDDIGGFDGIDEETLGDD